MSKHQNKLQQKSPAKPEIDNDRGALDDQDLAKVTGGDKASPQGLPHEAVTLSFARFVIEYS
jgi:hypothetical protein